VPEEVPAWMSQLPRGLQQRFSSLGKYVEEAVKARVEREPGMALSSQQLALLKVAVIATRMSLFMQEATKLGERAVSILGDFGADGFSVGSATFRRGSADLLRGAQLAAGLAELVPTGLGTVQRASTESLSETVRRMHEEVRRASSLG
jgi:hypothetical protein